MTKRIEPTAARLFYRFSKNQKWKPVKNVSGIGGPEPKRKSDVIDISALDPRKPQRKRFKSRRSYLRALERFATRHYRGLSDEGSIVFDILYILNVHYIFREAWQKRRLVIFRLIFGKGRKRTVWVFNAYIVGYVCSIGRDFFVRTNFTLGIAGPISQI